MCLSRLRSFSLAWAGSTLEPSPTIDRTGRSVALHCRRALHRLRDFVCLAVLPPKHRGQCIRSASSWDNAPLQCDQEILENICPNLSKNCWKSELEVKLSILPQIFVRKTDVCKCKLYKASKMTKTGSNNLLSLPVNIPQKLISLSNFKNLFIKSVPKGPKNYPRELKCCQNFGRFGHTGSIVNIIAWTCKSWRKYKHRTC